jgi:hypothetical protein
MDAHRTIFLPVPTGPAIAAVLATGEELKLAIKEQFEDSVNFMEGVEALGIWWLYAVTVAPTPPGSTVILTVHGNALLEELVVDRRADRFQEVLEGMISSVPPDRPAPSSTPK